MTSRPDWNYRRPLRIRSPRRQGDAMQGLEVRFMVPTTLTKRELVERYADVANGLARWINESALPPSDLHAPYAAHALLADIIGRMSEEPPR